ncbi:hypothetical protein GCM10010365_35850 [Streptomyces poonensis]|uniref:Uncharacterized protein n=1 Tax=Streptomyces poonensis TaxID=68255 RepID=A0A918UIR5_9ACTN|nr:hypothetical protein GCM10010365_35850 [Streptomyces poonensis]GLJ91960.1 hypothetical protein GCM10017589_45680 [Streptomyces poonensis]
MSRQHVPPHTDDGCVNAAENAAYGMQVPMTDRNPLGDSLGDSVDTRSMTRSMRNPQVRDLGVRAWITDLTNFGSAARPLTHR